MWISIYTFAVYWAGSYFAEQDNSWHQVSIRDTPFTANHIIEFYFNFPFYVLMGGSAWLYARTRLPLYAKGISVPLTLAVVGPFMIFVSVGFNEWGHTFWFREEFFAAPIHWGFVTGVWFALGVGGILLQQVSRIAVRPAVPGAVFDDHHFLSRKLKSLFGGVEFGPILVQLIATVLGDKQTA